MSQPLVECNMIRSVNPATNDKPLEFNSHQNQVPKVPVFSGQNDNSKNRAENFNKRREEKSKERKQNCWDRTDYLDSQRNSTVPDSTVSNNLDNNLQWNMLRAMTPGIGHNMAPFPMVSPVSADSSVLTVMGMPAFNQFSFMDANLSGVVPMLPSMPVKEIIYCNNCTLYPPIQNVGSAPTRERPLGCRTVFVGGLPENVTEDIIREVFERCGPITIIRMSKKNFCHIRFEGKEFVDNAIFLSGYRMRIGSESDSPKIGRLHVDYAQAREDQYEWECGQRALERERRHRKRIEQDKHRPPSPPIVTHYSEYEALQVNEKLRASREPNDSFHEGLNTLVKWLERGDCSKKSAGMFYNLIQGTNSHVKRLINEKNESDIELNKARENVDRQVTSIASQFVEIEKVFTAACHQKVWDHFTKAQRKNIEIWRNQMQDAKRTHLIEVFCERGEAEMDLSDQESEPPNKKTKVDNSEYDQMVLNSQVYALKEENDTLKCQLEAYKNEVDLNKADYKNEIETKDKQMKLLQQALQGMQQQLILCKKDNGCFAQNQEESEVVDGGMETVPLKKDGKNKCSKNNAKDKTQPLNINGINETISDSSTTMASSYPLIPKIIDDQARLIGLISIFLHVHPFGASVDYIWSYLEQIDESLQPSDVETLMLKFPTVFKQQFSGIGAKIERKWIFQGFNVK